MVIVVRLQIFSGGSRKAFCGFVENGVGHNATPEVMQWLPIDS
jgi:hypothetical protein